MTNTLKPPRVWFWFVPSAGGVGTNIRKWSHAPFPEGVEYVPAAWVAELEAFQKKAIKQVCELSRQAGEAKGKLEASEMPGIVDAWRAKCEGLEKRIAELEEARVEGAKAMQEAAGKLVIEMFCSGKPHERHPLLIEKAICALDVRAIVECGQ